MKIEHMSTHEATYFYEDTADLSRVAFIGIVTNNSHSPFITKFDTCIGQNPPAVMERLSGCESFHHRGAERIAEFFKHLDQDITHLIVFGDTEHARGVALTLDHWQLQKAGKLLGDISYQPPRTTQWLREALEKEEEK